MVNKHRKTILYTFLTLIIIGLLALLYFRLHHNTQRTAATYHSPTAQEKKANEQQKLKNTSTGTKTISDTASGRLEISSLTQDQTTKDVVVQTKLYDVTWKQCTLTLSFGNYKITKTADVLFSPDFSTCEGFVIHSSEFPSAGNWSVILSAQQSNGATQSTAPQTINVSK